MEGDNDKYVINEFNKLKGFDINGFHCNDYSYYDDNDEKIQLQWLRCVNIDCDHKFILNNEYSDGTVYLLCPDCNTFTSCKSYEDVFDDDAVFWDYVCKDCHGYNSLCDCHNRTPDGCGHCGNEYDCGNEPCEQCIKEHGKDNYEINDDGYWYLKNSIEEGD